MPILNIYRSTSKTKRYGKTVYLDGLRIFRHKDDLIVLTYDTGKPDKTKKKGTIGDICYIERDTDADKFFRKMLKGKI